LHEVTQTPYNEPTNTHRVGNLKSEKVKQDMLKTLTASVLALAAASSFAMSSVDDATLSQVTG